MQKQPRYIGLHFKAYDDFIFTPVIKKEIIEAEPTDKNYITVYLPSYCEPQLRSIFSHFRISVLKYSAQRSHNQKQQAISHFCLLTKALFNQSFIHCSGIITGGGFETPAEALHLGKKIITIPIRSQYEQQCNAAALREMGVLQLKSLDENFGTHLHRWMNDGQVIKRDYSQSVAQCLAYLFKNTVFHGGNKRNNAVI